jgi:hypothetical protein
MICLQAWVPQTKKDPFPNLWIATKFQIYGTMNSTTKLCLLVNLVTKMTNVVSLVIKMTNVIEELV